MTALQTPASLKSLSTKPQRSVHETIAPLDRISATSVSLVKKPLPVFEVDNRPVFVPRYLFLGPKGGADPIRVGFFSTAYGDEPEGAFALIHFAHSLERQPELARDFCLFLYPILNPTGFEANTRQTRAGVNIPSQIWKNSLSPEVHLLQSELWMRGF